MMFWRRSAEHSAGPQLFVRMTDRPAPGLCSHMAGDADTSAIVKTRGRLRRSFSGPAGVYPFMAASMAAPVRFAASLTGSAAR